MLDDCSRLEDYETEEASDLLDELFRVMGEFAPPYCTFGASEGDGADFGFWTDRDAVKQAIQDDEMRAFNDLADVPEGHNEAFVVVNDHGNMTLYVSKITYESVWAVV